MWLIFYAASGCYWPVSKNTFVKWNMIISTVWFHAIVHMVNRKMCEKKFVWKVEPQAGDIALFKVLNIAIFLCKILWDLVHAKATYVRDDVAF